MFKIINDDLLIGHVYLGEYPHGSRVSTFPMTRRYRFTDMTVNDHAALYASGSVPTAQDFDGIRRMDVISNANHAAGIAYLAFQNLPDGRFAADYQLMGLMEGLVTPDLPAGPFPVERPPRSTTRSARSGPISWWASTSRNCPRR